MRFALTDVIEGIVGHPIPERSLNATIRCPLPTHPERQPSFSINLDTGLWMCHACAEKGGLSRLADLMEQEIDLNDVEVRKALELAKSTGFEEQRDFWDIAVRYEIQEGDIEPPEVRAFRYSRAIHERALLHYRIGWDPAERRIVFPYWDDGKCVAIKYRYVDREGQRGGKGSETGSRRTIMGIDDLRGSPVVFLCEGESDTLALWSYLDQSGIGAAVGGIPGAANTADRWELWALDMLWASHIYICFDGDEAGDKGAQRGLDVLGEKASRIRPPDGYDMASYLVEGGKMGALGLRKSDLPSLVESASLRSDIL